MQSLVNEYERQHGEKRPRARLVASTVKVYEAKELAPVRELCQHPRIFPHISDDFSDRANFPLPDVDSVRYLLCSDERGAFGFVIFMAQTWACWSAHVGFLPRAYGAEAARGFRDAIAWLWANTQARRITGEILRSNTLAIRFARQAGFEIYGINRQSKLVGGVMRDQICLGLSKPE